MVKNNRLVHDGAVGVVVLLLAGALGGILNALGEQIQQDALRTPRAGKAVFLIPLGFLYLPAGLWAFSAIDDDNVQIALFIVWLLGGVAAVVVLRRRVQPARMIRDSVFERRGAATPIVARQRRGQWLQGPIPQFRSRRTGHVHLGGCHRAVFALRSGR